MDNSQFTTLLIENVNSGNYYAIKRSFGQTLDNCDINALIAFTKISQDANTSLTDRNVEFLVAGLCYNTMKQNSSYNTNRVSYETVLRRLYKSKDSTDSIRGSIENLLKLRYDQNGYFNKKFVSLSKKVIPLLRSNESFNYSELLEDLKNWNNGNRVKLKWAKALVVFDDEKKG